MLAILVLSPERNIQFLLDYSFMVQGSFLGIFVGFNFL